MQYRSFGKLDWKPSALGFGAMRLPTIDGDASKIDEVLATRMIRTAIDEGVNYVDTAWPYHQEQSEPFVGRCLQDGYREKVKLVTKLPMFLVRRTDDFERYLNQQMERLQTDFLDIYLFHSMNAGAFEKMKRLGLIEKMQEAQKQGRIGHIGFSFHDTQPVFREIIDYYDWDMTQIQYNYMDTAIQATTDGLEYAHSKGIAVVVMEPVKGGTLANPPAEAVKVMDSSSIQRTPVDWALQFIWNKPEVATVLSGMSNMQQVVENCDSADRSGINTLSEEENEVIDRLAGIYRKKILVPCTDCEYCMPCPHGVNIPQNFAILNTLSLEQSGIRRFQTRRSYRKLVGNPDLVNKDDPNGNGAICTECGICVEKCPQEINIPVELEKTHAILGKRGKISQHFDRG